MSENPITNCHVHVFTMDHVPGGFVPLGLMGLLRRDYIRTPLIWVLERGIFWRDGDRGERAARFARIGGQKSQKDVFEIVEGYYPSGTRFVILPMDMALIGRGTPPEDIVTQHDKLAEIARETDGCALPFCAIDPRRGPDALKELRRCREEHGFHGVKLYPPLGYAPDDPLLMQEIYPYCVEHGLPIMSHCSRGGVRGADIGRKQQAMLAGPDAFLPVLKAFPTLRVCLAHFGGGQDWEEYLTARHNDSDEADAFRRKNWLARILDLLESGEYPNLWTDISYTCFEPSYMPALNVFLASEKVRSRVLFGSDYFMTETEKTSERTVSIGLRHAIGEANWNRIARENPVTWLQGPTAGV